MLVVKFRMLPWTSKLGIWNDESVKSRFQLEFRPLTLDVVAKTKMKQRINPRYVLPT